ncbi:Non-specific serine/threonine protein kinase [Bertholletia excelsa]
MIWVWKFLVVYGLDQRSRAKGGFSGDQVETVLHLGLPWTHPEARARTKMRQVFTVLEGEERDYC